VNEEIRNHAGTINNMIADALKNVNISIANLSAVAVCEGPGSYTGLRIAMATAKGLCYAAGLPLILNDRLSLLAYSAIKNNTNAAQHIATILTAREKEFFISIYNNDYVCEIAPIHISDEQLLTSLQGKENLHIITDVPEDTFYQLKVIFSSIDANIKLVTNSWIDYTYNQYKRQGFANLTTSVPLYLKQVYTHK
jgi:tRNA threonylcarbamoyladenosine biosynthesis protein TsaB